MATNPKPLIDKIAALPANRIAEIEDFIDFIADRENDRSLRQATPALSAPVLAAVWDNPEDNVYDAL